MSKNKYYLPRKVKDHVVFELENYHKNKREIERCRLDLMPSTIANYNFTGGGRSSEPGNPTERAAIRMVTNLYILTTERSVQAIDEVLDACDDLDKSLIDMVYWKKTFTVYGAGLKVNLSRRAAYDHISKILYTIACKVGWVNL